MTNVSVLELLNFVYANLMEWSDQESRKKINAALEGRLGESGGEVVSDPTLPESMQGMEAPSWWSSDSDPFADQHTLSNVVPK